MTNRKILYGYQIRNGALEIVPEEQRIVRMVFTLYNAGASYQNISDSLDQQNIPYSVDAPAWNKHKVKRLLENPRYIGRGGYPAMLDAADFQAAQGKTAEKNASRQTRREKAPIAHLTPYLQCTCGTKMMRIGGSWQAEDKVYLKCTTCGSTVILDMDGMVTEIIGQFRAHENQALAVYAPSAEVFRLNNAINRGLEQPESPETVMMLILQGAAARYDCCPDTICGYENSDRLTKGDWRRFHRAVSHITITPDGAVRLTFLNDEMKGKDE